MSREIRDGILAHYGSIPEVETNYWDHHNGPAWTWWIIAILPLDPRTQVRQSLTSLICVKLFLFSVFPWYQICEIWPLYFLIFQLQVLSQTALKKRLEAIQRILRYLSRQNNWRSQGQKNKERSKLWILWRRSGSQSNGTSIIKKSAFGIKPEDSPSQYDKPRKSYGYDWSKCCQSTTVMTESKVAKC